MIRDVRSGGGALGPLGMSFLGGTDGGGRTGMVGRTSGLTGSASISCSESIDDKRKCHIQPRLAPRPACPSIAAVSKNACVPVSLSTVDWLSNDRRPASGGLAPSISFLFRVWFEVASTAIAHFGR